jgi:hypothetical protein
MRFPRPSRKTVIGPGWAARLFLCYLCFLLFEMKIEQEEAEVAEKSGSCTKALQFWTNSLVVKKR